MAEPGAARGASSGTGPRAEPAAASTPGGGRPGPVHGPGASAALGPDLVERAVAAAGRPDAPAILLLHGTRRTRAMWHHQVEGLADAFRVVALDLPGHGALVDVPFRLADASAAAALAIEGLPGGRAVVVGQSLGGYVGTDLAARRPDLVAGLVLVNSSAEPRSVARRAPATVGAYLARATAESLRARSRRTGRAADAGDGPGRAGAIVGRDGLDGPDGAEPELPATKGWLFRGSGRALVAALRESFVPRLAAYPGPTLILNGADDALFRSGERTFLAVAADGRLEVIPGTGHLVCEEQPAAFNAAVRRFAAEAHERPRA